MKLTWHLYQDDFALTIKRRCSTCGYSTTFTDTGKKRRNANGKNIFEYAIYRCEKGHSWNKKIRQYKTGQFCPNDMLGFAGHNGNGNGSKQKIEPVTLAQCHDHGIGSLYIQLDIVQGQWRLDKLLSDHISDVSRSEIRRMIRYGKILFNQHEVKPGSLIKRKGEIQINLEV